MPMIKVSGYEAIDPNSVIVIYMTGIESIKKGY